MAPDPQRRLGVVTATEGKFASPARWEVACRARHRLRAFPSLCWRPCARKRARTPRGQSDWTRPPGRWGNARRRTAPAPLSKPVTPASRLVAQVAPSVASGLGLRILAAGPARDPHLLLLRTFVCADLKARSDSARERASAGSSPAGGALLPRSLPAADAVTETATRESAAQRRGAATNSIRSTSARTCSSPVSRARSPRTAASMASEELIGMQVDEVARLDAGWLLELLGIPVSAARRECALVSLNVVRHALTGDGSWPSGPARRSRPLLDDPADRQSRVLH
jgi:hypothetical protein